MKGARRRSKEEPGGEAAAIYLSIYLSFLAKKSIYLYLSWCYLSCKRTINSCCGLWLARIIYIYYTKFYSGWAFLEPF